MTAGNVVCTDHFGAIASWDPAAPDSYRGIPIHSSRGLHEFAAAELGRLGLVRQGASVLDLGPRAGAMAQRLGDSGMLVTAAGLRPAEFLARGPSVRHVTADADGPFEAAVPAPVDLVVAVDTIGMVENPNAFLRSCFACLLPGGSLLLTAANADSSGAAVSFLMHGTFARLPGNPEACLHVPPVHRAHLLAAADRAGFRTVSEAGFGAGPSPPGSGPVAGLLLKVARASRRADPSRDAGILVCVFRRPA